MNDGDVRLTEDELRTIAEIERRERPRFWSRLLRSARTLSPRQRVWRPSISWTLTVAGTMLLALGLVIGQPVVGFVGFVVVVGALGQLCCAITPSSFVAALGRCLGLTSPGDP